MKESFPGEEAGAPGGSALGFRAGFVASASLVKGNGPLLFLSLLLWGLCGRVWDRRVARGRPGMNTGPAQDPPS